jgi:hypothetical protein
MSLPLEGSSAPGHLRTVTRVPLPGRPPAWEPAPARLHRRPPAGADSRGPRRSGLLSRGCGPPGADHGWDTDRSRAAVIRQQLFRRKFAELSAGTARRSRPAGTIPGRGGFSGSKPQKTVAIRSGRRGVRATSLENRNRAARRGGPLATARGRPGMRVARLARPGRDGQLVHKLRGGQVPAGQLVHGLRGGQVPGGQRGHDPAGRAAP